MQNSTSLLLIIISVSFLFLIALDTSNHCLLNTARPGEPGTHDGGESASGDSEGQLDLERKKEKKFSLLRKLMRKTHRDEEHDRA